MTPAGSSSATIDREPVDASPNTLTQRGERHPAEDDEETERWDDRHGRVNERRAGEDEAGEANECRGGLRDPRDAESNVHRLT